MIRRYSSIVPIFFLLLLSACRSNYIPAKADYEGYPISASMPADTALQTLLKPYRDSVNNSMDQVVGYVDKTLERRQPENTLGRFVTDALFYAAKEKFGVQPDFSVVNFGGLRLTQLPQGPVTRGKIFELMPFDNLVVLQRIKGSVLQQFLDLIAERGGWPFTGLEMEIKDKKAVNVRIGGKPLDMEKTYILVNTDYVANGGDNAIMLKSIPQENIGYLMRDAIFDHIKALKAAGKNITPQ